MEICYDQQSLERYMTEAVDVSPDKPVLIDKFLEDAIEVDVDAISDGETTVIGGIMEHIEEAGVHSGDSACALPPYSLPSSVVDEIRVATRALAGALQVRGLMNIQFAVKVDGDSPNGTVYVLEVNPSRQSNVAVCVEGNWSFAGKNRSQGHGGCFAEVSGLHRRNCAKVHLGQGKCVPVQSLHGRGYCAWPGNAIDG
jgi:carbamoylphosphate synthase large subunit